MISEFPLRGWIAHCDPAERKRESERLPIDLVKVALSINLCFTFPRKDSYDVLAKGDHVDASRKIYNLHIIVLFNVGDEFLRLGRQSATYD